MPENARRGKVRRPPLRRSDAYQPDRATPFTA